MHFEQFAALPFPERQLIVFADGELVEFMEGRNLDKRGPSTLEALRLGLRGIDPWGVYKAVWRTATDRIKIRAVPEEWAGRFGLSVGHPKRGVVYTAHPVTASRYIPVAEFHRFLFEQKVTELVLILTNLGAVFLEVECIEGWAESMAKTLSIGLAPTRAAITGANSQAATRRILFQAQFRAREIQELPHDLIWLPHEPVWQQLVQMRRTGALEEFSVRVDYRNDFGISAELVANLQKLGVQMGGQFVRQESTVWAIAGTFPK